MSITGTNGLPGPSAHPHVPKPGKTGSPNTTQQSIVNQQLGSVAVSLGSGSEKITQKVSKEGADAGKAKGAFALAKGLISLPRYLWNKSGEVVQFVAGRVGERGVFALQNLDQTLSETDILLNEVAKGPEFGQILEALSPMISNDIIAPSVGKIGLIKGLRIPGRFLEALATADLLPKAIRVILTKAVVNIAGHMRRDAEFSKLPVTPVNVLAFLFKAISFELQKVSAELEKANSILNDKARRVEKLKIVAPVVEKILQMVFPNGASDFPAIPGIRHLILSVVKNSQLPDVLLQFYDVQKYGVAGRIQSSEFITKESCKVAKNTTGLIKTYLATESQSVADLLFSRPGLKNTGVESSKSGRNYLAAQLKEFGERGDIPIWGLIEGTIKTLSGQFFTALSKNKKPGEEASAAIATQMLSKLSLFAKDHGRVIAKTLKTLRARGLNWNDIQKENAYVDKFLPLAKSYREMMGFAVKGTELPDLLRGLFDKVFTQQAAKSYESILLPLVELYDAVNNQLLPSKKPHSQPIPEDMQTMCLILGQLTAKKLPEWLKGQSKIIADSIASNLPKEAEDVRAWLGAWINGQLVELVSSKNRTILNLWGFVASTVPKVLAHVLTSLSEGEKDRPDVVFASLNKIFGDFFGFAEENGVRLKQTYEELKKGGKDPSKEPEFIALFDPFCAKLLEKIGVGKGRPLPVPELLNKSTEAQLKEASPQLCAKLYCDFSELFFRSATRVDEMGKDSASEGVAKLSEVAAKALTDAAPQLFTENSDKIADTLVDSLYAGSNLSGTTGTAHKAKLKGWLAGQIKILGPGLRDAYPQLGKLLGAGLETLLTHIFFSLSKDNTEHAEVSIYGIIKIFKVIYSFVKANDAAIAKTFQQLNNSGVKDPASYSEYIQLFKPLSDELQQQLGLSEFPGLIKDAFAAVFANATPAQIARYYRDYLVPLSGLFDAIDNPKSVSRRGELEKLPGGARLASWCEFAGKFVGEGIPKLASDPDQRKGVSEQIAMSLVKAIAHPDQQLPLKARLAGKQVEGPPELRADVEKLVNLYKWFGGWLDTKLAAAGNRQEPQVKKFWDFIQVHLDAILAHIMLNLVGNDNSKRDVLFVAADKLINNYVEFINLHGDEITTLYEVLVAKKKDPAKDKEFIHLFEPLYDKIITSAGLHHGIKQPLPEFLIKIIEKQLKERVPELLAGLYSQFSPLHNEKEDAIRRIRVAINPGNQPSGSIYGDTANAIQNLCAFCSTQIVNVIKEARIESRAGSTTGTQVRIEDAIPLIRDKSVEHVWQQTRDAVNSILLQLIANRLESTTADGKPVNISVVNDILDTVLKSLLSYTDEEKARIDEAMKMQDPIQQKKELRRLFAARASSIYALLKPAEFDPSKGPLALPLPSFISDQLWTQLEHTILPDFMSDVYKGRVASAKKAEESTAAIEKMTGNTLRSEASDVIAEFVAQFLPSYTKVEKGTISELIYEVASDKLAASGNPEGLSLLEYLKRNQPLIQQELCHAVLDTSPLLKLLQPFTKENIKPILVQAFTRLTERIENLESPTGNNHQKEFLANLGERMINIVKDHLESLNKIARQHRSSVFHKIDHDTLIKEFSSLHRGIAQSPNALQARKEALAAKEKIRSLQRELQTLKNWKYLVSSYKAKTTALREQIKIQERNFRKAKQVINEERRAAFFGPFSEVVMELAGLKSANDLPFPSPMREVVWEQFRTTLMPSALMNILDSILEPASRNRMIITALESYNDSQNKLNEDEGTNKSNKKVKKNKDPLQVKLDKACGDLLKEVVKMVPHSFIKSAVEIRVIKDTVAAEIGQSIREQLSEKLNLQKIIDMGIASGIPSFHKGGVWKVEKEPGVWVEIEKSQPVAGKVKFFPAKIGPSGKMVEIPVPDFDLPQNEEDVETAAIKRMDEEEASSQQMRNLMISTTHKAVGDIFKAPFVSFLKQWDKAVNKVFGKYSEGVRSVFRFIGFRAIYKLLETVANILFYIPKQIFWFFMDWHITTRVDEVIKGLKLDIHENLLYNLCDELAKSLGGKVPQDNVA